MDRIPLADKVYYTFTIADNIRNQINLFFLPQSNIVHVRIYCCAVFNFSRSCQEILTQTQFYVFLETEVPTIIHDFSSKKSKRFMDLCCKVVKINQDGVLVKREVEK